jgi:hypothetical protein
MSEQQTQQSAQSGAGPASGSNGAASPPDGASPVAWLPGADVQTATYAQVRGWTGPDQVVESYRNLEKLLGADRAGNTVVIPGEKATPEDMGKFYDRLGRPSDAAGYKVELPKAGGDPEFMKQATGWFHELGLSQRQGKGLADKWNGYVESQVRTSQEQTAATFKEQDAALKMTWGQAYQQNLNQAQAAVRGLGVTPEQVDHLAAAMGHKATMEFFQKIGSRMSESEFASGETRQPFGAAMTPDQAKLEIKDLMKDGDFVEKIRRGDKEAQERWTRLHGFANPEPEGERGQPMFVQVGGKWVPAG